MGANQLLSWRSITDPKAKPNSLPNPEILRGAYTSLSLPSMAQRYPYKGLSLTHSLIEIKTCNWLEMGQKLSLVEQILVLRYQTIPNGCTLEYIDYTTGFLLRES